MKLKEKMIKEIAEDVSYNIRDNSEILEMIVKNELDKYFSALYYQDKVQKELNLLVENFKKAVEILINQEWHVYDEEGVDYYVKYKVLTGLNSMEDNSNIIRKFLYGLIKDIVQKLESGEDV